MRILVVDDDYVSRTKLKCLLSEYGDVDVAPNGDICLRMMKAALEETLPYTLMTIDINMPGLRGPELVDEIKKWEKEMKITDDYSPKIIMITGTSDRKDLAFSILKGAEKAYIIKPVNESNLREALETLNLSELLNKHKKIDVS